MANPCEWNGTRYRSQVELARAAGKSPATVAWHLTMHGHLDRLGIGKGHRSMRKPVPESEHTAAVRLLLPEGFGAEDIARRLEVPADVVRAVINDMRASGEIDAMFPRREPGGQA